MSDKKETPRDALHIVQKDIAEEMRSSYLDYAMSVITARALPDVRDGLKPVQRRIIYAMHGMGLRHSTKTRKSATVVGETLGKYHPHGNMAVYDAMAKLAQDFVTRYPLVIGQGNFGSIDGDSPAAERYTEAKMSKYTEAMLENIDKDTVLFVPNYENTLKEPVVLPAKSPNLLVNGALGIAVGMATDIPPHNMNEVTDALMHLLENPDATTEDLLTFIQGPDFPKGGIVYDKKAILQAYATGRGGVVVRGEVEVVENKKNTSLIITSIPYRVNKARLIEKVGELVRAKKIEGIKDLRDESTEDIRVVIDLKSGVSPQQIKHMLYRHTQLQDTYHYNMVGLLDGAPQKLTLHTLLQAYIDHRRIIIERAVKFDLERAKNREHIVEGLKKALDHIDKIITLIKKAREVADARAALMKTFAFSEIQANAILEMRLSKLAGLERKKVEDELVELRKTITRLESILKSKKKVDSEVKKDIEEVKKMFGDKRRTKVVSHKHTSVTHEDLIPEKDSIVMITGGGYVKRTIHNEYKKQRRGGVGLKGAELKSEDFTTISLSTSTHDTLYFFSDKGKVYQLKAYGIPEAKRTAKGRALVNFISITNDECITSVLHLPRNAKSDSTHLFFATKQGTIKKVRVDQFKNIRKGGIVALSLRKDDRLVKTQFCTNKDCIMIVTKKGKAIQFQAGDVRATGRTARGVCGIKLGDGDEVISVLVIPGNMRAKSRLLTVSDRGFGKQTAVTAFRIQKRGGTGLKAMKITDKTGDLVGAHILDGERKEFMTMSKKGQIVRIGVSDIPVRGRQTQGVSVMKLKGGDKLTASICM